MLNEKIYTAIAAVNHKRPILLSAAATFCELNSRQPGEDKMKNLFKLYQQDKKLSHGLLTGLVVLLAVAMGASPALARGHDDGRHGRDARSGYANHDHDPSNTGYMDPGLKTTAAGQVSGLASGQEALLKGHIIEQVGTGEYLLRDSSGTALVLISQGDWNNLQPSPADLVEIHGQAARVGSGMAVQERRIATIPS